MRKVAIFLFCVLIAISSTIGCSPREYTPPPPAVPPPPIPVVLITGGEYTEYGMVIPKEITIPFSSGVAILEKTSELAPYGEPGNEYMHDFAWYAVGKMIDIVIESDHRLTDEWDVRDTVAWMTEPESDEPYTYPVSIWSRVFYVNKETRIESPGGSHIIYNTVLRLVFLGQEEQYLEFTNSSDDLAHITYKVYDAGIIKDYQKFLKWMGNLESMKGLTEEEWLQALESWNLERIDYRTLVSY